MRILIIAGMGMFSAAVLGAVHNADRPQDCSILDRPAEQRTREDIPLVDACITQLRMQVALAVHETGKERTFGDEDKVVRIIYRSRSTGQISKEDLDYVLASWLSWKALALNFGNELKIPVKEQDAMLGKTLDLPIDHKN